MLVLLAAAGVALWLWWRARRVPLPPPKRRATATRYPVVLAHGLFGFDEVRVGKKKVEYFRGIPGRMRKMGTKAYVTRVGATASIEARAQELAALIRELDEPKVNVIAHSMGGLDARYALAKLGLAERVASLTTIGTPHRGTPLGDLGAKAIAGRFGVKAVAGSVGIRLEGIDDAATERMRSFNEGVLDTRGVAYASYVSAVPGVTALHPMLVPGWLYVSGAAGANDGVVPAASQRWGDVLAEIEADHWAVVGWSKGFDAGALYASLLRELKARGF